MQPHEKIIYETAKKLFIPEGLFRKGVSRTWLENNGYYITQVEFQPSGSSKGTYLNAGISFLWEDIEWHETFYRHCSDILLPQCKTKASAQKNGIEHDTAAADLFQRKTIL